MDSCSSTLMQAAYNFKGSWDNPLPGAIQGLQVQSLSSELPEAPPSLHSPWEQPSLAQVWPSNPASPHLGWVFLPTSWQTHHLLRCLLRLPRQGASPAAKGSLASPILLDMTCSQKAAQNHLSSHHTPPSAKRPCTPTSRRPPHLTPELPARCRSRRRPLSTCDLTHGPKQPQRGYRARPLVPA